MSVEMVSVISLSLQVSLLSVVLGLPAALLAGWFMARKVFMGKSIIDVIINIPLVLPPVTAGFLLLLLLGRNSLIGKFFEYVFGSSLSFSKAGAVVASMVVSCPLLSRGIRTAFEMCDTQFEQIAGTLGWSPVQVFLRVTLPLIRPGIVSGVVTAFARSLGEFGATMVFAGNLEGQSRTIPLAVYSFFQVPVKENEAWALVSVSIGISVVAMVVSNMNDRRLNALRSK